MRRVWVISLVLSLCAALALPAWAESGTPEIKPVDKGAEALLQTISFDLTNVDVGWAVHMIRKLINIDVQASVGAAQHAISLKKDGTTVAEALRQILVQAGCEHRFIDGKILIATPEEFKQIDAGKAKFEPARVEPTEVQQHQSASGGSDKEKDVGDNAKLLMRKVTLELVDTPLDDVCKFLVDFAKISISASKAAAEKTVNLSLQDKTLAEALRQIKAQAGVVHRINAGKILLGIPEDFGEPGADKPQPKTGAQKQSAAADATHAKTVQIKTFGIKNVSDPNGKSTLGSDVTLSEKVTVNGREYTMEELKKEQPAVYEIMNKLTQSVTKDGKDK